MGGGCLEGGRMSSYHLNRFLFDLKLNEQSYKQALKDGDPRRLRQLGAHGMLALYILRLNPEFRSNIYWTQ